MQNKKCSTCNVLKSISEFYKSGHAKYGVDCECKECSNVRRYKHSKTIFGLVSQIYADQRRNSKDRKHNPPKYTKDELLKWINNHKDFEKLYNEWIKSNYYIKLRPSVDRKNNYKGYSFDNIQLVTWQINQQNASNDIKNGIDTRGTKAVLQYDKQDNFIKEYYSMKQAGRETRIHNSGISKVCNKQRKTAGKFIWKFKNIKI